ncbi:hypothetical protein D3C86_1977040 [compost metagenome]
MMAFRSDIDREFIDLNNAFPVTLEQCSGNQTLFIRLGFQCNRDKVGEAFGLGGFCHDNIDIACFSQMHGVDDVDIAAEMAGEHAFHDIAG